MAQTTRTTQELVEKALDNGLVDMDMAEGLLVLWPSEVQEYLDSVMAIKAFQEKVLKGEKVVNVNSREANVAELVSDASYYLAKVRDALRASGKEKEAKAIGEIVASVVDFGWDMDMATREIGITVFS